MKTFDPIHFDFSVCRTEVAEFANLLTSHPELEERRTILPFFQTHPQAAAICSVVSPLLSTGKVDIWAREYDVFGEFASDLVIGDSRNRAYCFIEFEDAMLNSIFKQTSTKSARDWSSRFEHGFSQITDWIQKLTEMEWNAEYDHRFGRGPIHFDTALIVGRTTSFRDMRELTRFRWRQSKVIVDSRRVNCFTFDDLLEMMKQRLDAIEDAARRLGNPTP